MRRSARRLAVAFGALLVSLPALARGQDVACDPGDREVRSLAFDGNRTFPDRDLALRVSTTPSSFARRTLRFAGTRRCIDAAELGRDVTRLRLFYRRRGFYETKVDTVVAAAGPSAVRVTFRIDEGAPILIDSVALRGLDSLSADALRAVLGAMRVAKGQRFDQERMRATSDSIRARLRDRGYPRADVAEESDVRFAERRAFVGFTVVPGQLAHIGRVVVRVDPVEGKGQQISESVVRRLAGLREGTLYRDADLSRAHRNLYQSSGFRHVDVRIAYDSLHPRGDSVLVVVDLREDLMRQLDTEAGWATIDCLRARAQYVDRNFLNGARRLELTTQASKIGYGYPLNQLKGVCYEPVLEKDSPFSDTLHYFVGATLRQPAFLGTRFTPAFSVYRERRGEYLAYLRSTLLGGEASAVRDLGPGMPLRLAYKLEYGRTEAQPALLCFIFSRCDAESQERLTGQARPLAVASASVGQLRVDNVASPTRGRRYQVELRSASRFLGSDESLEFTKGWIDGSWYRPLGGGSTLAARIRLGAVLGNSLSFAQDVRFVPPEERLYAGGATSVRGFQQNELGAVVYIAESAPQPDTVDGVQTATMSSTGIRRVVPLGGNSLVVANLDWRLRSPFYPELLQWTLFADAGEVWTRERGKQGLGFRQLKWTPGVGVRVTTFVGPIAMNVAYNPYPRPRGAVFYDAPVSLSGERAEAPLFCVTPGNALPATFGPDGRIVSQDAASADCTADYRPPQSRSFFQRLAFTFSIGPDF